LSPLLGALYLQVLDERLGQGEAYYVRYMDDILVLTRTRWQLRRAVRTLNRTFAELKLSQHPDKTFIGRIERGFDFWATTSRAARYGSRIERSRIA
jgi:RNA-directed DNA polymerase